MKATVLKAGLMDTVQDGGRYGYSHIGLGPGGAMDGLSMALANALLGNDLNLPVVEMHFPAATIYFEHPAMIALTGADARIQIGQLRCATNRAILVPAGTELRLEGGWLGQRVYLAVAGGWQMPQILHSASTHLQAGIGQLLQTGEQLHYCPWAGPIPGEPKILPYQIPVATKQGILAVMSGPEWNEMNDAEQLTFLQTPWQVSRHSNRMAVRLDGGLPERTSVNMISAPVCRGTIQWVPQGHLLVLMAEHQTVGGYPRVLQLAQSSWCQLAQAMPGEILQLSLVSLEEARKALSRQQQQLLQWLSAVRLTLQAHGIQPYIYAHGN